MVFFIGNEPGAKGLPSEVGTFVETHSVGGIFIEDRCTKRPTHSVGEIFFNKTFSRVKIVCSSYDFAMRQRTIKKQKIDSSFHSESLSGISNSERVVKNLYGSLLLMLVILYRR